MGGSIILRHGDDGPEYGSTPVCIAARMDPNMSDNCRIYVEVFRYLLQNGFITTQFRPAVIEERGDLWEDFWKMRKET
jgi:hypothetical protein